MFNSRVPVCCFLSLLSPLFLISSQQEQEERPTAPRTEIMRWNACIGFPLLAFPYGESDYLQPSFDMDCLLALWPLLHLASLVTCKVWSFDLYLKKLSCKTVYILTQSSIKHPCSTRDWGPCVLLSLSLSLLLSLSLSLSGWFFGAWKPAELIFLPGLSRPLREDALCLRERYKHCLRAVFVFSVTQGVLASFLLSFSYGWLQMTRFLSLKDRNTPTFTVFRHYGDDHSYLCEVTSHCSFDLHFFNNSWCWASSYVPLGSLYVFFG